MPSRACREDGARADPFALMRRAPVCFDTRARAQALDDLHYGPVEPSLARAAAHLVDTYFGDDYEGDTPAQGGAPPEAFVFGAAPPPPGGFSFGAPPAQPLPPAPAGRGAHLTRPAWMN